jgi:2-aminoadipate transaminase
MLLAVDRYLPAGVSYDPPQGGLFLWLRLPENLSSDELLPLACEEGVAFAPGDSFFPEGSRGQDWMRLNFVAQSAEEIDEGIKRLGKAIKRLRARS